MRSGLEYPGIVYRAEMTNADQQLEFNILKDNIYIDAKEEIWKVPFDDFGEIPASHCMFIRAQIVMSEGHIALRCGAI